MVHCSYLGDVLLCRSALEYALVDRAEILGIENTYGPGGSRPDRTLEELSLLIEETIASRPQLEGDLELIKKHGNLVAHPKTAVNPGTADADITRGLALESINATLCVLTDVYGQESTAFVGAHNVLFCYGLLVCDRHLPQRRQAVRGMWAGVLNSWFIGRVFDRVRQ